MNNIFVSFIETMFVRFYFFFKLISRYEKLFLRKWNILFKIRNHISHIFIFNFKNRSEKKLFSKFLTPGKRMGYVLTYHINTLFEIELSTLFPGTVQLILVLIGCFAGTHLQYDNLHKPLCSAITKTISAWSANNAGRRDILPRWSATNRALRPSCTD